MRYTGIQPQYFPRQHYFARLINSDVFVSRDDCQFLRKHKYPDGKTGKSYQAHTPIKTPNGEYLLNIPTVHKGLESLAITQILYDSKWWEDHLKTIQINYSNAPNFKFIFKELELILHKKYSSLAELNLTTILWGIHKFLAGSVSSLGELNLIDINEKLKNQKLIRLKKIYKAVNMKSTKNIQDFEALSPNQKIVNLIKETGANEDYCGGTSIAAYLDHDLFEKNNVKITVQDWKAREYSQLFMKQSNFISNLSIIDLFMNINSEEALRLINE